VPTCCAAAHVNFGFLCRIFAHRLLLPWFCLRVRSPCWTYGQTDGRARRVLRPFRTAAELRNIFHCVISFYCSVTDWWSCPRFIMHTATVTKRNCYEICSLFLPHVLLISLSLLYTRWVRKKATNFGQNFVKYLPIFVITLLIILSVPKSVCLSALLFFRRIRRFLFIELRFIESLAYKVVSLWLIRRNVF